jgi:hypothetical protein
VGRLKPGPAFAALPPFPAGRDSARQIGAAGTERTGKKKDNF